MCDFNKGFVPPEMVKRRPVVVISHKIRRRADLCTIVALSTTAPEERMPYHGIIRLPERCPEWMRRNDVWVKGDMVYSVSFKRLDLIRLGKGIDGKRIYDYRPLHPELMSIVDRCVLSGMGFSQLTKHLEKG